MVRPRAGHHMLVLPTPSHGLRMCVVSGFTSLDFEVTEVRNMCGARACLLGSRRRTRRGSVTDHGGFTSRLF